MARPATGTIVERQTKGGTSFALRFRYAGKKQFVTLGCEADGWTRPRAERELENVMADVRRGVWTPPAPVDPEPPTSEEPTLREFATEWFDGIAPTLGRRTQEDYRWALTHHLLPFFHRHRLSAITIREVDRYRVAKLKEGRLSADTLNKTITRLAQVLELAVEYGYLTANPARGKRRRAKAGKPRRHWLAPEQVKPLIDATVRGYRTAAGQPMQVKPDARSRALFATLICAGLRIGEALALRWGDVDLATGTLKVRASKTDAGIRTVHLWDELREVLTAYKLDCSETGSMGLVFGTSSGKQDTRQNVLKRLKRAAVRANVELEKQGLPLIPVPLRSHDLRRTFCALLYERGEQPVYVMDQMGHADAKLALNIYARVIADRRTRPEGARLTGVLGGVVWSGGAADENVFDLEAHRARTA